MLDITKIKRVMYEGLEPLGLMIFPERPEASTDNPTEFIVASLPVGFRSREIGGQEGSYDANVSTARMDIFVRDRMKASFPNEPNELRLGALTSSLLSLFPIVDRTEGIGFVRPRVLNSSSSDSNGYHYCIVQCTVTTMV